MAQYNMPPVPSPAGDYHMVDGYLGNRMTNSHDLGPWMESDGGGKFQLKRRRRCGQCGPCLVKENCNKCQYCLRKDVLKQACVHRKCVFLRKPAPRFRPESVANNNVKGEGERAGSAGNGGRSSSCSSANQDLPQKPCSTPVSASHDTKPAHIPVNPSAVAAAAAVVQSAELSSCQAAKSPVGPPVHKGIPVPHRTGGAREQYPNPQLDGNAGLDPSRSSCLAAGGRSMGTVRGQVPSLGHNSDTASCGYNAGNAMTSSPANHVAKECPLPPRDQFQSPAGQWGAVPYGFPHTNPWTHPALQVQHNPAAAFGFHSGVNHYSNPFRPSCQFSMSDPTGHFAASSQPSFHHNLPFSPPDFPAHANFNASVPSVQPSMTHAFYPSPANMPPSLPNFPSFSQLPANAGTHGTYSMAHPSVYHSSLYSSFRPPNEPQIYHVHLPAPYAPLREILSDSSFFASYLLSDKVQDGGKGVKEFMKKKCSISVIPDLRHSKKFSLGNDASTHNIVERIIKTFMRKDQTDFRHICKKGSGSLCVKSPGGAADKNPQQQRKQISDRKQWTRKLCDDFKRKVCICSEDFGVCETSTDSHGIETIFNKAKCISNFTKTKGHVSVSKNQGHYETEIKNFCEKDRDLVSVSAGFETFQEHVLQAGLSRHDSDRTCESLQNDLVPGHRTKRRDSGDSRSILYCPRRDDIHREDLHAPYMCITNIIWHRSSWTLADETRSRTCRIVTVGSPQMGVRTVSDIITASYEQLHILQENSERTHFPNSPHDYLHSICIQRGHSVPDLIFLDSFVRDFSDDVVDDDVLS